MTKEEIFKRLKFFNEKADKLRKSSFVKKALETEGGARLIWEAGKPIVAERTGPNQEEIDAALLTFRFFIQNNEKCSIANMAEVYEDPLLETKALESFTSIRKGINDFLNEHSFLSCTSIATGVKRDLTNNELMRVFIYGGLAHSNDEEKKEMYDGLMSLPAGPIVEGLFVDTMATVFSMIWKIRHLNHVVMNRSDLGHW